MLLTVLFFQSLAVQFSRTIPVKGFFCFPLLSLTSDLYIISYLEAFVKRFCKSFFKFLSFSFACLCLRFGLLRPFGLIRPFGRFWLTLILYHIFCRLSRGFRKFFSLFSNPLGGTRLADSLFSIPHLRRFVNRFLHFFRHNFHF